MRKRPRDDDGDDDGQGHKRAKLQVDGSIAVMHVDAGWTSALQRLIKGKASMDEEVRDFPPKRLEVAC
jgi:hypothetical protein